MNHTVHTDTAPTLLNQPRRWFGLCGCILLWLLLIVPWQFALAQPSAGTIVSNMAVGEFIEEGSSVIQTSRSNLVETTIIPVYVFTLEESRTKRASAGDTVYFQHILTNTGNIADSYALTLTDPAGGINFANPVVYPDTNQDGLPDGAALTPAALNNLALRAGDSIAVLVGATVPSTTAPNTYANSLILRASSQGNTLNTQTNNDSLVITTGAVLTLTKTITTTNATNTVANGDQVSITLNYTNASSQTAGQVVITDNLTDSNFANGELIYVTGNQATWQVAGTTQALTDANGGDPVGINYRVIGNTIRADITSVAANSSGSITFKAQVNRTSAGRITNRADITYDPDNNSSTANNATDTSNVAAIELATRRAVVLNDSASNNTNADDEDRRSNITAQTVSFDNHVWNTGNTADTYNLSMTNNTFPTGSTVAFFRADGETPLLDTNGDGIADTGDLAAGARLDIVVKITLPSTLNASTTAYSLVPIAQSIYQDNVTDSVTNILESITPITVDLSNTSPTTGIGNGNIDQGANDGTGAPLKTLSLVPGTQARFPLTIAHTGAATRYTLAASGNITFANALPEGISLSFYENAGTNCDSLGTLITETNVLNHNENQTVCALVSVSENAQTTDALPLFFRAYSSTQATNATTPNSGLDIIKNAIRITAVGKVIFTPDLRGQIASGGTIVYTHTLVNNTPNALTNTLPFEVTNDQAGFSTTLYYDANDNGKLDATDPIITDLDSVVSHGTAGLQPAELIRVFAKVANDGTALINSENNTVITLKDAAGTRIDSVHDITVMSNLLIRLTKMQALDANCDGTPDNNSFTTAGIAIARNPNGTGQCVLYKLIASNEGSESLTTAFTFRDTTPSGLVMESAIVPLCTGCTTTNTPPNGEAGSISAVIPNLPAGTSRSLTFGLRYIGN